jgi:hypothetical protein
MLSTKPGAGQFGIRFLLDASAHGRRRMVGQSEKYPLEFNGATAGVGSAQHCPSIWALGKVGTKLTLGM